VRRSFLACVGGVEPQALAAALETAARTSNGGTSEPVAAWREGALSVACTGARPAGRCLLDGEVHTLAEIAGEAGISASHAEGVLQAGWERLGADRLLTLLRGAFALLLWEPDARTVLAVRDHVGERGLVWAATQGATLIAGEPVELLGALARTPAPDESALAHWLAVDGMPEDRTLFEGIRRLAPGHALEISRRGSRAYRYWQPPAPLGRPRVDAGEAAERVRVALATAIRRRADERTGVLLSGGLDSSAVAGVAAGGLAGPAPRGAYSAVFPSHPQADEAALINLTAERLELALVTATVTGGSVVGGALEYLERWLLPPATPNLFFWLPLMRRAAEDGISTLLDGQGGDELFGLSPFLLADRLRRGDLLGAIRLVGRVPGGLLRPPPRDVARWLYRYGLKGMLPPGLARLRRRLIGREHGGPSWLAPGPAGALRSAPAPGEWKQAGQPRWWSHLVSEIVDGPGPNLAFDDLRRRDALAAVSSTHPLADVDLVELVISLPPELAYNPHHSRPLLRAATQGLIPDRVRLRASKSSFDTPFHDALAGPDLPVIRRLLDDPNARLGAYVDLAEVRRALLDTVPTGGARQQWALYLWRLVGAELWLRTLADRSFPRRLADEESFGPAGVVVA
jgi:asparagine synthase (glutamine-hydrolysing)